MATEYSRVWFKSISLENVRSFGTKQTVYFTEDGTESGNAARWNVILGDNGTGKTTVLKGLCLLREGVQVNAHWFERNGNGRISFSESDGFDTREIGFELKINHHREGSWVENKYTNGLEKYLFPAPIVFAYGAARRISTTGLTEEKNGQIESLFDESANLANAEEFLVQADYAALKDGGSSVNRYVQVSEIIKQLFKGEVSDIEIVTRALTRFGPPKVYFHTHYGKVLLHELSLGYKTLIAWTVDFAKGLLDRYPDSENPLAEPAVCLVDEIDLHLHPKFQRTIIRFLTETFPNTQFIVTAHSPLIVLAAEERPLDANIILLKREDDHTVVVNDPVDVSKWSVDQILNSDLFGYVPPASESLTELRTERDALLAKPKLAKKEKDRLAELDEKIGFIPFGTNQNEIKAETIIQQLANALRSKQEAQ